MKIGILSMQKILNYGSFLQAYSLKKQFENKGHDVYFIDIKQGKQVVKNNYTKTCVIKKLFQGKVIKRIQNHFMFKKMSVIHADDYTRFLETDKKLSNDQKFDLVIIGSDEVFNCLAPSSWGFSTQLFGDIENAKNVVTYAAACGQTDYDGVVRAGIKDQLKIAMDNITSFSVRDENTKNFVESITGREAIMHLDPVFLYDYDKEMVSVSRKKPYVLIYAYSNRISDEKEIKNIKKYAKQNDLEIVCVGQQQRWCNVNICANAYELLSYFANADSVITDTFHGAVLSIKYNKKLGVLVRESNSNKLSGLLNKFNLENRKLEGECYNTIMQQPIDYKRVNEIIAEERVSSQEYFDKALALAKE